MTKATGNYFEHKSENARQPTYYTFTPKPLMKNSFYSLYEELSLLLIEAHTVLGVLEGMHLYMPDRDILQDIFLYKESFYSRLIDYSDTNFPFRSDSIPRVENTYPVKNIR